MNKAIVIIDAAYLSYVSKFLGGGKYLKFKVDAFSMKLANRLNLECELIYYYTAPPYQSQTPSVEENAKKANYDKFISKLNSIKNPLIKVREGRCQKIGDQYIQKGVDTLITMDLIKISKEQKTKTIILITSDTDFVPVIKDIRNNDLMKVILAYFSDRKRKSPFSMSNHLWNAVDKKVLIKKTDFM